MRNNSYKNEAEYNGFWKYMKPFMREYNKKIFITMICSVIVGIFFALQPLVIKWIVDEGISNNAFSSEEKLRFILLMCFLYIFLASGRILMWKSAYGNMLKSLEGSIFNLRSEFFSHVENLCMKFYDKISVGELFNYIMGTPINNIKTYIQQMFLNVPYQAVSLVISLVALSSYNVYLTVILFLIAITMAVINAIARRKIRTLFKDYIQAENEASHYINDTLHGMEAIKLYSIEENTFNAFKNFISDMYKKGVKATVAQANEQYKPEFVLYLGTAIIYFVGSVACIYSGMSVGTLYAFLSSMTSIFSIVTSWLNIGLTKSAAEAGLHKILRILDMNTSTPEIDDEHIRKIDIEKLSAEKANKPCIEFSKVKFGYDNKVIFNNFNCNIEYGQSVAFVGSSGSGKSTLTKLAMRLYEINDGEIKIHGRNIKDYSLHDLRSAFGVVPQNPFIFHGSIWDNILIAKPDATNKEVIEAMDIARVHDFVNDMEYGWNTIVGDGAFGLSGGQKQKIAIARAVLGKPDILIFDEATSALDNISEKHIQKTMEELMRTHTVIIVAHRLSTIRNVDRILVFEKGEIVQDGKYEELSQIEGEFKRLLNAGDERQEG